MDDGLAKNDPYRGMSTGNDSVRPDFLGSEQKEAANELKSAEKSASGDVKGGGDALDSVRSKEGSPDGLYSGSGRSGKKTTVGGKIKAIIRKNGPLLAVLGALVGIGGALFGAQSLMPVAISEMIIQKLNSIGVSTTITSDLWLDTQLNSGIRPEGVEITEENKYAFSQYQVRSFASHGMKLTDEGGVTKLMYEKNGEWIAVVGSEHAGAGLSVEEAMRDRYFRIPYTTASKGWRGGSSGWFDAIMTNITEIKLSITRNRWIGYTASSVGKITEDFVKKAESAIKKKTSDADVESTKEMTPDEFKTSELEEGSTVVPYEGEAPDGGIGYWDSSSGVKQNGEALTVTNIEEVKKKIPVYDKNGEIIDYKETDEIEKYIVKADNSESTLNDVADADALSSKMMSKAMNVANAAKTGLDIASGACAAIEAMTAIYTVISAYQTLQFLNLTSGFLESVDKMKVGQGTESPIHEYGRNLTTKAATNSADGDPVENEKPKTAVESAWFAWLFSDTPINSDDTSVRNTNIESIMANISKLTGAVSITAKTYEMCGYTKIAAGVANLTMTVMSYVPIIGGAAMATQVAIQIGKRVAIAAVLTAFFGAVIPVIAKKAINTIAKDVATEWFGEDLGNAMLAGAGKYLGGNGLSGGQSAGSMGKVLAYMGEQQKVIANEAEYQRSVRSPFDISSPYTFLGSLAYSVMPMAYSGGDLSSMMTNMSSLTSSSIASLSPSASAVELNRKVDSIGDCPYLEGVGAVGDASCNPYIITDTSTIEEAPKTVSEQVQNLKPNGIASLNEDGTINDESNLAKYAKFCGQRTSQLGLKDSGIVDSLQSGIEENTSEEGKVSWTQKVASWAGKLVGLIPGISDTQNILEALNEAELLQWATGEACVASDDNPYWEENKVYQRYMENERLLENINPGYESTVTAYLKEYYEENPIDNSFEGQLARFSGMNKDDVESTLALIVYYDELAKYNPSERFAFGKDVVEKGTEVLFDNDNYVASNIYYIIPDEVVYADVRNKQGIVI